MALKKVNFNDICAKELSLPDENMALRGNYAYSGSFGYKAYEILKNVYDVKTNNFSNLVLSRKTKNSDFIEILKPETIENNLDIITALSFYNKDEDNGIWLCFNKSYDTWDNDISTAVFTMTKGKPNNYSNYLFRLEIFEDENYCQISHNFGDLTYYLAYDDEFKYISKKSHLTEFLYQIDNEIIRLYKNVNGSIKKVVCKIEGDRYNLILEDYTSSEDDNLNDNIFISLPTNDFNYYVDGSWVTYNRSNAIDAIDNDYSTFNLDGQFLLHHEYSTSGDVNIIPLKNTLTYQGSLVNGTNNYRSDNHYYIKKPLVDFRTYTNINSGINQEYGNDNIILTFSFKDQEYHIMPGEEYDFTIPLQGDSEISPLYPYKSININDSAFVKNGAFGSDIPYFADNFRKLQNENTKVNTGTYLCTWLYQPNADSIPIWLDRYYYPDMVQRHSALKGAIFEPSFNNIPDTIYNSENTDDDFIKEDLENFKLALQNNTYVDKKSDVLIEPGTSYSYKRIGKENINTIFDSLETYRINNVKDQNGNNIYLDTSFAFNKENWIKIPAESFKNTSAINFNTNLYINPYKKLGLQLFGSDYNNGVNIQNRKDLAPFHYYASVDSVHLLNNKYELQQSCNIKEKYNTDIKRLIIGAPFDDIYVLTNDAIIIMEYDLKLKSRILYNNISNLKDIIFADDKSIGKIISEYKPLNYDGNLYIPINNKNDSYIIKIIFKPNNGEQVLSARRLLSDEFVNNFTNIYDKSLIETDAVIKSLYVDNEGIIYAFNYDKLKMSHDGDTIYGIYNNTKQNENVDNWYYIFNQSIGRLYSSAAASKYAEFSSDVSIDNIALNPNGEIAIIRGFRPSAGSVSIDENEKRLEIYSRSKTKIYNYPLKNFDSIKALDYYTYIDDSFEEQMVFAAVGSRNGKIVVVEYQSNNERVKVHYTNIDTNWIEHFDEATYSNALIEKYSENKLYFNMFLPMGIYNEKLTIKWDLKEVQEGWYNINVEADCDNAIFKVKINDEVISEINHKTHPSFYRFTHNNDSIFDSTYYFGIVGKEYGSRLHEILNNSPFDPYTVVNTKTENTTLYIKKLKYHEYQAMRLFYSKVNELTITLPCGVRNGIEEIVRYFRYRTPGYITNKVKINISGLEDIKYESEMNALKNDILEALKASGDCLTKVNEIEFI